MPSNEHMRQIRDSDQLREGLAAMDDEPVDGPICATCDNTLQWWEVQSYKDRCHTCIGMEQQIEHERGLR